MVFGVLYVFLPTLLVSEQVLLIQTKSHVLQVWFIALSIELVVNLYMFDYIAYAKSFDAIVFDINRTILNPLIQFAFVVAFVIFIWGLAEFIRGANNPEARKKGQDHMLWGTVGLVIMVGVYGIILILVNTFGLGRATLNSDQQTFIPPPIKEVQIPK